jgi:hypothetical protein
MECVKSAAFIRPQQVLSTASTMIISGSYKQLGSATAQDGLQGGIMFSTKYQQGAEARKRMRRFSSVPW